MPEIKKFSVKRKTKSSSNWDMAQFLPPPASPGVPTEQRRPWHNHDEMESITKPSEDNNSEYSSVKSSTTQSTTSVEQRSQSDGTAELYRSQNRAKTEPKQSYIGVKTEPIQGQNKAIYSRDKPQFRARIGAGSKPKQSQFEADSEPGSEPKKDPADLSKLQLRCLQYIFASARFVGSHVSERLSSITISEIMKSTPSAIKKAMQRLEGENFIVRDAFKKGPGGWSRYRLPEQMYRELSIREIRAGSEPKQSQFEAKTELQTEPGSEPNSPSSSSYINNDFKPTTELARARMDVWAPEDLDYSMLSDIGFGRSQAMQLRSLGISYDVAQRSLVYFEFELRYTESGKSIKEPLALLMKRLRQNGCWEAPEEYQKRIEHFQTRFKEREKEIQDIPSPVQPTSNQEGFSS